MGGDSSEMHKRYSQKMYLFFIYGTFILILLSIFFSFTYAYYRKNTLSDAKRTSENLCVSVNSAVTSELDNMSTISMNIVYSNAIKTNFKEFSRLYQETGNDPAALISSREKANAIQDIITAIIGAYQSASAVKLYTMDGSCVEVGNWMRTSTVDLKSQYWYEEVVHLNGHKFFTTPYVSDDIVGKDGNIRNHRFISLIRLFLDSGGKPEGIVEVVQDCSEIFSLVDQVENTNPDSSVYIYNSYHELVYPYTADDSVDFYYEIAANNLQPSAAEMIHTRGGKDYLCTYETLSDYDWTVIITQPEETVYLPLRNFQIAFIIIAFFSILFTLLVCFYISLQLTKPLQKLTNATSKITINRVLSEDKVNLTSADSHIQELSTLCESIRTMYEKLRSTSQEVLLSKSEETRAKLQATQSLINPHFLYNSLTNISIMAEEQMNDDIIHICQALCDYFRYISSGQEMIVPLKKEIFYTERYLECMKFRFGQELSYNIRLAEGSEDIVIPKLIIQPIVENAFKYAFNISPPWELTITSDLSSNLWTITVEDNGGNLSSSKKEELLALYKGLDMNEELKSMHIGGMGLKNVYLRLKLLYGDNAIFEIDNSVKRRTLFTIGGPIYHSREEYYEEHPHL